MKVAIIGSRSLELDEVRDFIFDLLTKAKDNISCIISGGADGPDKFAELWVYATGGKYVLFRPEYSKHGKGATFVRNSLIIEEADVILAFWDSRSKGTLDSINKAKKSGKKTVIYEFKITTEKDEDDNPFKTAAFSKKTKINYE